MLRTVFKSAFFPLFLISSFVGNLFLLLKCFDLEVQLFQSDVSEFFLFLLFSSRTVTPFVLHILSSFTSQILLYLWMTFLHHSFCCFLQMMQSYVYWIPIGLLVIPVFTSFPSHFLCDFLKLVLHVIGCFLYSVISTLHYF